MAEEKKEESEEEKVPQATETKKEKFESLYSFTKSNTKDTIAYILLIFGIILVLFERLYGGLIIGAIFGLYFANEITKLFKDANGFIDKQGMTKSLVIGATLLALFVAIPGFFIGAGVLVGLRNLFLSEK